MAAYQHFPKRRPRVTVRAEWYPLWPKRGRNYRFWMEVGRRVKARRVRHKDYTRVRAICIEVEAELHKRKAKSASH